jgi:hypothetical protein
MRGALDGFRQYLRARANARAIERELGPQPAIAREELGPPRRAPSRAMIERPIDLDGPLHTLDVADAERARIVVRRRDRPIGTFVVRTRGEPIVADRLADLIVTHCIGSVHVPTDAELTSFVRDALRDP